MQIKFFKKEKNFTKEEDSLWLHVNLYWGLAVLFVFAGSVFASWFGYHLFTKINEEPITPPENASSQIETVKKETIDKELQYFREREKKSAEIINFPSPIVDPSL